MRILVFILAAAALFAACGDDSDATPTATTGAASTAAAPTATQSAATASACPTPPAGPQFAAVYTGTATVPSQGTLLDVDAATAACSDTVTFTFNGTSLPSYEVKYVQAETGCGSGLPITTAGSAQLRVRFEPAVAHDDTGNPSVTPNVQTPNFASVKELKPSCDFEGVVVWVIGTEAGYYTVTPVQNPPRLIVEISH